MYRHTFIIAQYKNGNNLSSLEECYTPRESQQHPEGFTICTKCDSLYCKIFENCSCSILCGKVGIYKNILDLRMYFPVWNQTIHTNILETRETGALWQILLCSLQCLYPLLACFYIPRPRWCSREVPWCLRSGSRSVGTLWSRLNTNMRPGCIRWQLLKRLALFSTIHTLNNLIHSYPTHLTII